MDNRTAAEIIAWHNRTIDDLTEEEWNEAARWADAHWADQPHERSVGHTYREVITGSYPNTNGARAFIEQEEI